MKTIKTLPEFASLSELEINAALDAYDDLVEKEHNGCEDEESTIDQENPIVSEVSRLIRAYTGRMNELIDEAKIGNREISENFLAEMLSYEPASPIERIAFDFVTDAILDDEQDE